MDYIQVLAQIHAKLNDKAVELEDLLHDTSLCTTDFAVQTRQEWQEELDALNKVKADFLQMTGEDPIEAINLYHEYLFPNQLEVKHALQAL